MYREPKGFLLIWQTTKQGSGPISDRTRSLFTNENLIL